MRFSFTAIVLLTAASSASATLVAAAPMQPDSGMVLVNRAPVKQDGSVSSNAGSKTSESDPNSDTKSTSTGSDSGFESDNTGFHKAYSEAKTTAAKNAVVEKYKRIWIQTSSTIVNRKPIRGDDYVVSLKPEDAE